MSRIPRMIITGEPAVYHVVSRTVLEGYVLGDEEKEHLLECIRELSSVYFVDLLGFCLMGDHFHLLVRVHTGEEYSETALKKRYERYRGKARARKVTPDQLEYFREKWSDLSEYVREIKQVFSRYYNKKHNRRGFLWAERFKSVIVEEGETLIQCLAYIDLNPVRAGLVEQPEEYPWCSLGHHVHRGEKDRLLSLDFELKGPGLRTRKQRLAHYREFMNEVLTPSVERREKAGPPSHGGRKDQRVRDADPLKSRSRYFTDSGIIGSKAFVSRYYQQFKGHFASKHEKRPRRVAGLDGVYSLKRLSEDSYSNLPSS